MASGLKVKTFLESFGVSAMPWVARAYLFLLTFLLILLMGLVMMPSSVDLTMTSKLFDLLLDLVKLVVGAFLGSLSMAAQRAAAK